MSNTCKSSDVILTTKIFRMQTMGDFPRTAVIEIKEFLFMVLHDDRTSFKFVNKYNDCVRKMYITNIRYEYIVV